MTTLNQILTDGQDVNMPALRAWLNALKGNATPMAPEDFGALGIGDAGAAADSAASAEMYAAMLEQGWGYVRLRPGAVYSFGAQIAGGGGQAFQGADFLNGTGLEWLIVEGNFATIRSAPGQYFGGFASGTPTTALPNYNAAQRADIGTHINLTEIASVSVSNLLLDGNIANQIPGGPYGDTGRQCRHDGVRINECDQVLFENVWVKNVGLDGFIYKYEGLTGASDRKPALFINCGATNCGRNGFSQVGGNMMRHLNCKFTEPGNAPNSGVAGGYISSAPKAACDIEAEGSGTEIDATRLRDSVYEQGSRGATAIVADSGTTSGVIIDACTGDGAYWLNKPNIQVLGGELNGHFAALYGGDPRTAVQMIGVRITDRPKRGAPLPATGLCIDIDGAGAGVWLERCDFRLSRTKANLRKAHGRRCNWTLRMGTTTVPNRDFVVLLDNAATNIEDFSFYDELGQEDGDPYTSGEGLYIVSGARSANTGSRIRNCMIYPSSNWLIKYDGYDPGGGAYPHAGQPNGRLDFDTSQAFQELKFQREATYGGGYHGWSRMVFLSAAPGSATGYANGSLITHIDGGVGDPAGWIVAGGAFQPNGVIGMVRAAAVTAPTGGSTVDTEARAAIASLITNMKTAQHMLP
ncbi:hypothetical protein [Sphingomonas hengshuiensis]|uniref:Right handed beta helix domain-containing protein n=1 Tax=Sphingomonas hengshuiensis TaxID=1609977 RepID=A0A7U4LF83_9SPHN|nr:hypothetical protein [Sphingomonas hengshuiensis]AJP72264.1 hypothetical protein TS85_11385 [Sphingomonas hengshuiensis]